MTRQTASKLFNNNDFSSNNFSANYFKSDGKFTIPKLFKSGTNIGGGIFNDGVLC
jgi:hypothetical protein